MANLLTVSVWIGVLAFAGLLCVGMFCAALSIATSRLGEDESEPDPYVVNGKPWWGRR